MFEMPFLLSGLALASVPVIIHLLHRQRTDPIPWGAMQFLDETVIDQRRRKRIDHWLLMLARILALAILALLLARPVLKGKQFASLAPHASTDVAVVIDHSLASGRRAGSQTVFRKSVGMLKQVIGRLQSGDTITVVLAQAHPRALDALPLPARSKTAIRHKLLTRLERLKPGLTAASIPAAIVKARDVLSLGRNSHKAIFVISDEQAYNWQADDAGAWQQAVAGATSPGRPPLKVFDMPLPRSAAASDVSVGWLQVAPRIVGVHRQVLVSAAIHDSGPGNFSNVPVQFSVDGRVVSTQTIDQLGAGKTQTVQFPIAFDHAGSHWLKVKTPLVDALAADNWSLGAVRVWRRLPVLIVDGQMTSVGSFRRSMFLRAAMQPVGRRHQAGTFIQPTVVSVSDAPAQQLRHYAMVILNDVPELPGTFLRRLKLYANAGHGLWIILGPHSGKLLINQELPRAGLKIGTITVAAHVKRSPAVVIKRKRNPTVRLLAAASRNAIVGVTLRDWWNIKRLNQHDRVILATSTGHPLALERSVGVNGGQVVLWTTAVDGSWNDWPTEAGSFVPLVNETVYHLALSGHGVSKSTLQPGQTIQWIGPATPPVDGVTVTRPNGITAKVAPLLTSTGRYMAVYNHTSMPGLYTLHFSPTGVPQPVYYAVAVNSRELNFAPLRKADLIWLKKNKFIQGRITPQALGQALGGGANGLNLWPFLALLVVGSLALESFLTWRMARQQAGPGAVEAGMPGLLM